MTDFLDRLAMEVDVWSAAGFHKAGMKNDDYSVLASESWEDDWLRRRAELINEPDDKDAPEWANWKAQDSCGKWFWYKIKPTEGESFWVGDDDGEWQGSNNGKIPAGHDWSDTLTTVLHPDVTTGSLSSPVIKPDEEGLDVENEDNIAKSIVLIQELVYILNSCEDDLACLAINKKIRQLLDRI